MKRALSLCLVLVTALAAAAQTTNGNASGLKAAYIRQLRAAKLHFLLPTNVPKGYRVKEFKLHRDKRALLVSLEIWYRKGTSEILFQETSEGIGDVIEGDADNGQTRGTYTFYNTILPGKNGLDYQMEHGKPAWYVNWIKIPQKRYPHFVSAIGTNADPREGVEFMESLRFLK